MEKQIEGEHPRGQTPESPKTAKDYQKTEKWKPEAESIKNSKKLLPQGNANNRNTQKKSGFWYQITLKNVVNRGAFEMEKRKKSCFFVMFSINYVYVLNSGSAVMCSNFWFPDKTCAVFFFLSDPSHALKNYSLLGMRREARERQSICILSLRLRCSFPYSFFFFFTLCLSRSLRTHGHTKKVSSLLDAQIFLYLIRTLEIRVSRLYALGNTRFLTSCQQRKLPIAEDVF
jgi:hypothetical protein